MKRSKKPLEYYLIAVLFTLLILVCFLQVLFRFVLSLPLAWTEELSRYLFILLVYVGASAAAGEGKHVRVEIIDSVLPAKATKALNIIGIPVLQRKVCYRNLRGEPDFQKHRLLLDSSLSARRIQKQFSYRHSERL